jgi:hypothetical protein
MENAGKCEVLAILRWWWWSAALLALEVLLALLLLLVLLLLSRVLENLERAQHRGDAGGRRQGNLRTRALR